MMLPLFGVQPVFYDIVKILSSHSVQYLFSTVQYLFSPCAVSGSVRIPQEPEEDAAAILVPPRARASPSLAGAHRALACPVAQDAQDGLKVLLLDGIRLVLCSPLLGAEPLMCRIPLVPTPLLPRVARARVGSDKAGLLRTRGGRGTPARAPSRWVRSWPPGSEARLHRTQLVIAAPPTLVSYDLPRLGGGAERSPITSRVSIRVERERGGPPSALQFVGRGRRGDAELAVVVGKVEHV